MKCYTETWMRMKNRPTMRMQYDFFPSMCS